MIRPHGGTLINRVMDEKKRENMLNEYQEMTKLEINAEVIEDIQNIAHGVFSPIEGFLVQEDVESIIKESRLVNDVPFTIPITLDVSPETAKKGVEGEDIALTYKDKLIGILYLEQIFDYDKERIAESVFQTKDMAHPGVAKVMNSQDKLFGGKIDLVNSFTPKFEEYSLFPMETRILFKEKNWRTVVGFQTRNVPHLGHEYVQKTALTFVDGLFINPIIGKKKTNDFLDEVILKAYGALMQHYYLREKAVLAILRTRMRYAGPKEAIFHSIVRKNFGCTHFIVGRDHAGVGNYYGLYDAHKIFEDFTDLGIQPVFFKSFFKCSKCGGVVSEGICSHGEEFHTIISGKKIRQMLVERKSEELVNFMRPEVIEVLIQQKELFVK